MSYVILPAVWAGCVLGLVVACLYSVHAYRCKRTDWEEMCDAHDRVSRERDTLALALALRQRKPSDEERTADFIEPIQWPCPTEAQLIGRRAAKEYNEQILKE